MRSTTFAVLLVIAAPTLAAQEGGRSIPARLSLAEAIAVARENNPAYRQALNAREPASWANRNALLSTIVPTASISGGLGYSGTGSQRFLTSNFTQQVATVSSNYGLNLNLDVSGQTLAQPSIKRAELQAADADVRTAADALVANVTAQYLTVLQAIDEAKVAEKLLERNVEFLKLAQGRYQVGQATLVDVRRSEVNRGQSEVALLRARTRINIEKLRLFELLGVTPPTAIDSIALTDTFPVALPPASLEDLMTMAAEQNPALQALRDRERAANWGVKSATSGYAPTVSLSAGWSGFTQTFAKSQDLNAFILGQQAAAGEQYNSCQENNLIRANSGLSSQDCSAYVWTAANEQAIRGAANDYPFNFTGQPFQARLTVSLPLWLNFQRPAVVSAAKAQQLNLAESVRARALALQTEVNQDYVALQAAFQAIAIQDTNRIAGREQLQLAAERYRVGAGTFLELQDAQVADLQAQRDYIAAVYDYHRTLAALEQAVGRSLR